SIEPLIQGAAGMRLWPVGMLKTLREWCDKTETFLIFDEVLTGFGRTGTMFACEQEKVTPDFIALAKGLTGGYLPLAATLTTEKVFKAFLGEPEELKTFFYGHSYCGNPLGCAAALANLAIFEEECVLEKLAEKITLMRELLSTLSKHPHVGEIRQCGFIAGIDIVKEKTPLALYACQEFVGARICQTARKHGLLTRPVVDTLVLMPPYCITEAELQTAVNALSQAISEVCG
ncbi:MAG: aminotransferase class III-fold pyridoxal phosphate-dependent enzyme, partial [Chthoniobacterales bacterium]